MADQITRLPVVNIVGGTDLYPNAAIAASRDGFTMQCYLPIELATGNQVSCGRCTACRINKRREWTGKMIMESLTHEHRQARDMAFLTLTYDNDHMPLTEAGEPTLDREETIRYRNRLRQIIGPFRYYFCGEYGHRTGRPHYHAILWGKGVLDDATLAQPWNNRHLLKKGERRTKPLGFISVRPFNTTRAAYVAGYTTKKITKDDDPDETRLREFAQMSRHPPLGTEYIDRMIDHYMSPAGRDQLAKNANVIPNSFRYQGSFYPISRAHLDRMYTELKLPKPAPIREEIDDAEKARRKTYVEKNKYRHSIYSQQGQQYD